MKDLISGEEKLLTIWSYCFSYCDIQTASIIAFVYRNFKYIDQICMDCAINKILGLPCLHK